MKEIKKKSLLRRNNVLLHLLVKNLIYKLVRFLKKRTFPVI